MAEEHSAGLDFLNKLWGFTDWQSPQSQQVCQLPLSFSNFNFVFLPIDLGNPRAFCIIEKTLSSVTIHDNKEGFKTIFWLDIGV